MFGLLQMMFDSVVGGPHCPAHSGDGDNSSIMYVLYQNNSAYPEFLVTYQKVVDINVNMLV